LAKQLFREIPITGWVFVSVYPVTQLLDLLMLSKLISGLQGTTVRITALQKKSGETDIAYVLESNPHPFCSFRGLKNQMRIRFAVVSSILEK